MLRFLRWLFAAVFTEQPAQPSPRPGMPDRPDQLLADRLFVIHQELRYRAGIMGLTPSQALNTIALRRVSAMAAYNVIPIDHDVPGEGTLKQSLQNFRYHYVYAGENMAVGQPTPEDVISAWITSQGHRDNILNPDFSHIGLACRQSPKGVMFWCVIFTRNQPVTADEIMTPIVRTACPYPLDDRDRA